MPPLPICTDWTSDDYDVYEADDSTDDESFLDEETCQKALRDFWNSHESTRTVREDMPIHHMSFVYMCTFVVTTV